MDSVIKNFQAIVGRDNVLSEPDELLVYECDGLPQHKHRPRAVIFPRSTEEVSEVMRMLARERIPFSPRGAGTGLSGGALALGEGVVIELARMRRLLKLDAENRLAVVETGIVNSHVSRAAAPLNLHYVPDPSSQPTCTIGGNLAENSGGIHCLKYGVTVDHVMAARVVLSGGEVVDLEETGTGLPGYDLLGVFIGSEGTFGIATEATLRLVPLPQSVRTLLADFTDVMDASRAVSEIIAAGIVPAALEMMDGAIIRAIESTTFSAGIPQDAEAALLLELDGLEAGLGEEAERAEAILRKHGARAVRRAKDEAERKRLWAARKGAFGVMGRISPDTMIQDAVVPRSRLPEILAASYRIGTKYGLRVANVFHAGDGNLHPFICFDSRHPDEVLRVKEAGRELMETCVRAGGSITGEHGVGLDKSDYLPLIFNADDMDAMLRVRAAFDPTGLCNPGKIIPTLRGCGEAQTRRRGEKERSRLVLSPCPRVSASPRLFFPASPRLSSASARPSSNIESSSSKSNLDAMRRTLCGIAGEENVNNEVEPSLVVSPSSADEACEVLKFAALEGLTVMPAGAMSWPYAGNPLRRCDIIISARRMNRIIEHEPADLIAVAEAGARLSDLNERLNGSGQWLALDPPGDANETVGGVAATGLAGALSVGYGSPRNHVIGMRVALADGRVIKSGGRVVKNVAGYDLCKLFIGSYGTLGLILELAFKLRPRPARTATVILSAEQAALWQCSRSILAAHLLPVAFEIVSENLAQSFGVEAEANSRALLVRFAGNEEAVSYQTMKVRELAGRERIFSVVETDDEKLWRMIAAMPMKDKQHLVWRVKVRLTDLRAFIDEAMKKEALFSNARWHACVADGRLRVASTETNEVEAAIASLTRLRNTAKKLGGALVIEQAPTEIKNAVDAWGALGAKAELMRRIKAELDPKNILSPGRF
ncbi:MAG: hypothetical protein AUG51_11940 [Acidobacteria bacterium 13_1_20CM_3_53_8]|nr:MAG: hypothetical protein AUG51_11940 [Acidobacteria bacterium 13_1_20CM_3_53_8]